MARKSQRKTVIAETDASMVGALEHHGYCRVKKAQAALARQRAEACARKLRDFGHHDENKVKEAHALLERLGVAVTAVREVGSRLTRRWAFDFSMADFLDLIEGKCDADLLLESGISLLELLETTNCVMADALAEYRDPDDEFLDEISVLVATEQFVMRATARPEAKFDPDTREWFAHQIIIAYINWKSAVGANDVLRASRLAARMFELRERVWWKFKHERAAVIGAKSSKSMVELNRQWATNKAMDTKPVTAAVIREFEQLRAADPHISVRAAAERIALSRRIKSANGGTSLKASAIRYHIMKAADHKTG